MLLSTSSIDLHVSFFTCPYRLPVARIFKKYQDLVLWVWLEMILSSVMYAPRNYGQFAGSFCFSAASSSSYVEFPSNGGLDAENSMRFVIWIRPESSGGPLFYYNVNDTGAYVWLKTRTSLLRNLKTWLLVYLTLLKATRFGLKSGITLLRPTITQMELPSCG